MIYPVEEIGRVKFNVSKESKDDAATAAGAILVVLRNDLTAEILEMGTTV